MKSSADFHFKQFSIKQGRSTHKVGTDGVLLGAWVNAGNAQRILDIGTGTGLIALMLAQRTAETVQVDAVEIDKDDAQQASENVNASPWYNRVMVHHMAIQEFTPPYRYDLIVSNPPYFVNSWLPPENKRSQARHTGQLSFDDLLQSVKRLLAENGTFAVILPYAEAIGFIQRAHFTGLYPARELHFFPRRNKPVERLLTEFTFAPRPVVKEELVLYGEHEDWSEGYQRLTRDFYLRL